MKNEIVFHSSPSSKDALEKVCAMDVINDASIVNPVIDKVLKNNDIQL